MDTAQRKIITSQRCIADRVGSVNALNQDSAKGGARSQPRVGLKPDQLVMMS